MKMIEDKLGVPSWLDKEICIDQNPCSFLSQSFNRSELRVKVGRTSLKHSLTSCGVLCHRRSLMGPQITAAPGYFSPW